ncbi:MAG TPA: recombinase family protein [Candidatus Desulfaltia sp.]|nr:recombinase family protein [Candidatus Desulfaltia sp.]
MENKAVVFCRVSTKGQAGEKWSLPTQVEFNQKYAKKNHFELVHEPWSIVESGYKDKERREFRTMVNFIKDNKVGNLIVLNVERLSRNFQGMVDLDELTRDFLTIHFTESGETIDKDTAGDKRAFWAIKVAFARYFIDDLKVKARRSYEGRLDRGLYPSNPPLGYSCKKNLLTPNEKEVPFVRRAFELYATGMESEFSLAEKLYEEGLRKRKGGKVSVTTLSVLLRNPVVIGFVVWPFTESKYVMNEHHFGEWIKGQHEPIVDRTVFDKVQTILGQKSHPHPQRAKFYTYRGLLRCGECRRIMSAYDAKGHTYYYSNHPRSGRCEHTKGYREELVEEKFSEALGRFRFSKDLYKWMKAVLRETADDKRGLFLTEQKRLQDEAKRNQASLLKLLNDRLDELFDKETIALKTAEIKTRQIQIKAQLERLEKDTLKFVDDGLMVLDLVQDLKGTFDKAGPQQRHKLLKILFHEVVVKDGKFTFHVQEPFSSLYEIGFEKRNGWLLGQDSNLEPSGYKCPKISSGLGLSLHPLH